MKNRTERFSAINLPGILLAVPVILHLSGELMLFINPALFFRVISSNACFLSTLVGIGCCSGFYAAQKLEANHILAEWSYGAVVGSPVVITSDFFVSRQIHFSVSGKTNLLRALAGMLSGVDLLASSATFRADRKASAITTIAGALPAGILLTIAGAYSLHEKKKDKMEIITD